MPLGRTVDNVATLSIGRRRLLASDRRHDHRIADGHLAYTIHVARLYSHAAFLAARLELADVPTRRARMVVARLRYYRRLRFRFAQVRRHHFFVLVSHAVDD